MKVSHPFRFGVSAASAASPGEWRDLARKVEELGYSSLLMPDHFSDQYGALVALTIADYGHPIVLAAAV